LLDFPFERELMTRTTAASTRIVVAAMLVLLCGFIASSADAASGGHNAAVASATKAAIAWLKLIDEGDYAASWKSSSSLFKDHISSDQWTQQVGPVRRALGAVTSRKVEATQYKTSMPGAPDGRYVVIHFQSSFEHKKSAIETVTPMLDKDGQWRVSGYYIK
jgi:hypothetical protein